MSQKPLEMNRIKQVQQLAADGVSKKEIKRRTGISLKTIRKYLRKLAAGEPDSDAPRSDKELAALVLSQEVPGQKSKIQMAVCSAGVLRQT